MKMIAVDKIAHFCAGWAIAATAFIFVGDWPAILLAALIIIHIAKQGAEPKRKRGGPKTVALLFIILWKYTRE